MDAALAILTSLQSTRAVRASLLRWAVTVGSSRTGPFGLAGSA
jgi:hypothetical protein